MTVFPRNPPRRRTGSGNSRMAAGRPHHRPYFPINLPDFDISYSTASWYRDYAAYCGISDDGKKVYAVVAQISRREPVLKKPIEAETLATREATGKEMKDASVESVCSTPAWQRSPVRVTFERTAAPKQTFAIRGHAVDLVDETEDQEDEEASK
jgi:hypothetical protein